METEDETSRHDEEPIEATKAAIKATVEHWAREKGMLAEFTLGQVDPGRIKRAPKSAPPKIHNKNYAGFAAARDSLKWDPTQWPEMTEAEFDAAVKQATAHAYH
jgi:hypothetical protein